MQHLPTIARVLLGLYFLIFGLNGFFHFLPKPPMVDEANAILGGIFMPDYQMPLVKAIEILGGIALLSNRFIGMALVLLAVITVQILLFHITYVGVVGSLMQIIFAAVMVYVMMNYKDRFDGLLKM